MGIVASSLMSETRQVGQISTAIRRRWLFPLSSVIAVCGFHSAHAHCRNAGGLPSSRFACAEPSPPLSGRTVSPGAPTVLTARVTLRPRVAHGHCEHGLADSIEFVFLRLRDDVFRGDQLDLVALAIEFEIDRARDLGVRVGERGGEKRIRWNWARPCSQCPWATLGRRVTRAVNTVGAPGETVLPESGGLGSAHANREDGRPPAFLQWA